MEQGELDRRIENSVNARADAAPAPAPPEFGQLHDRVVIRRRRHRVVGASVVAVALVIAGTAAWIARGDEAPTRRVHIAPADTTALPANGRCGAPVVPPTESVDLAATAWRALPPAPRPGRVQATYVWTGSEVIAFGGKIVPPGTPDGAQTPTGEAYDPATRTWRTIADAPFTPREALAATWTGTEMIVVSGDATVPGYGFNLAAAYDPARDRWRKLPDAPVGDVDPAIVWTGTEVVIWGTPDGGAVYDPCTNRWRTIAPMPEGGPLGAVYGTAAVWTGTEVIVWAGSFSNNAPLREAAAYDPATDRWRVLPISPVRGMFQPEPVWTGRELVAWGWGNVTPLGQRADFGAALDPRMPVWREMPTAPLASPTDVGSPSPRLAWTGTHALAWTGGLDGNEPTLLSYDPARETWTTLDQPPAQEFWYAYGFVWAGDRLLVFTRDSALELASR
jgi:hypothetical protein